MAGQVVVPRNFKLIDELEKAEKDPSTAGISLGLQDYEDIYMHKWNATIFGPMGTTFENRIYSLQIYCGEHYPKQPPEVKFLTKVAMECVDPSGVVMPERVMGVKGWRPEMGMIEFLLGVKNEMTGRDRRTRQPPEGTSY